ncbi:transposase [Streptomyces platensis]|uniref:transposase n=1 Tax=Streptomyces platensis TaxID=58346 RepID=UPI002ED2C015|nr:transposase [Streptomyces platensis]
MRAARCYGQGWDAASPRPHLLIPVGIGPDSAVTLLITMGDNPERLGSEASFAALCGVSPVERSSGRRNYRQFNRGGERQANAALHRVVQTRLRFAPRTQECYKRRIQEGKTRREITRCLKRYAAREVFHLVAPVPARRPGTDLSVTSVAWRARRPLHPQRLADTLPTVMAGVLRGRGHLWLSSRPRASIRPRRL